MRKPKFITLTADFDSSTITLRDRIREIKRAMGRLRRKAVWSKAVSKGVWFLGFTPDGNLFRPHLHIVVDSAYFDHRTLSRAWEDVFGSPVVDIRRVWSDGVVDYLLRQIALPPMPDQTSLFNFIRGTYGERLFGAFGNLPKIRVSKLADEEGGGHSEYLGNLSQLATRAAGGDSDSLEVLSAVEEGLLMHCDGLVY